MALAGYCAGCGENVWLTPSGDCPRGHGADQVSNVYEASAPAPAQPAPAVQDPPGGGLPPAPQPIPGQPPDPGRKKTIVWVVVSLVLVALLGCCLIGGLLVAIAIPAFNSQRDNAQERTCFSNQRNIEAAAQTYGAENNGEFPETIGALVPEYLKSVPVCPSDGTYTWDPADASVTCSVHGHY
jgi:competence protein ComGC